MSNLVAIKKDSQSIIERVGALARLKNESYKNAHRFIYLQKIIECAPCATI